MADEKPAVGQYIDGSQRLCHLHRPPDNRKDHARANSHISAMREDRSKSGRRIEPRAGIDQVIVGRYGFEAQVPSGPQVRG